MLPTHIHLMITHLPIFGSMLGLLVLLYGIIRNSAEVKKAAYIVFFVSAIGGMVANATGEEAEEFVEHLPGYSHSVIHEHEEFAEKAIVSIVALGLLAIAGFVGESMQKSWAKPLTWVVLLAAIVMASLTSYTGYLGGHITHTEIYGTPADAGSGEHSEEDHH